MEQLPAVPDVAVERALPGRPDTWRGRSGRQAVDVTVVTLPTDPAIRRAALAALTPLVADAAGALPRGRAATLCRDGVAFVADACDGSALPRTLTTTEVRTIGTAAARAVGVLHGRGLTWGGSAAELLVGRDGTVRLPYDGMVRRRVAGRLGSVAGDLTAVLSALADRSAGPGPAALVAHPPPDARGLVRALRRPRVTWRGLLLPGAVVAVVAAAAIGWWSALPPHPAPTAVPVVDRWADTVHELDAARTAALSGHAPLAGADALGTPAARLDTATRADLVRRHLSVLAPEPALVRVVPLEVTAGTATLRVTDTLAAYVYRDAAGRVVGRIPARSTHTWTVTLRRTVAGWRYASVS